MGTMDANTRNWVIGGVVAIIVIVLGWWLLTKPPHGTGSTATSSTATSSMASSSSMTGTTSGATVTADAAGETLSVADQTAGKSVTVTGVSASKTTWVAVRDTMRVYGARRVEAGAKDATVTVPLLKPIAAGDSYQVVMYVDNGDNAFDLHKDALITGVGTSFKAQ